MTRVTKEWIVENKWRCSSCDADNLGRHTICQSCGSTKEKDEQDSAPDEHAPAVTDPELLRLAAQKANWVCEYCGSQVRDEHGKCRNCAAARAEVASATAPDSPQASTPPNTAPVGRRAEAPRSSPEFPFLAIGCVIFGGLLLAALGIFLFAPHEESVHVTSTTWAYRVDLSRQITSHGTGWEPIRSDAFNVSCNREYYGKTRCDPYKCRPHSVSYDCHCRSYDCNCRTKCRDKGNGFSSCSQVCSTCRKCDTCSRTEYDTCYKQCDVYKNRCSYDYNEWIPAGSDQTNGVGPETRWPTLQANGPLERISRIESYAVTFSNEDGTWTYEPGSLSDYQRFRLGAAWKIKVARAGGMEPLLSLDK